MGKKARMKALRRVAEDLPILMATTHERHIVKGRDLIEQGMTEWNGRKVLPEAEYVQNMPVKLSINHYRRLKKAYAKGGVAEAQAYLDTLDTILKPDTQ